MPPIPAGYRGARVLAADIRPGDMLHVRPGWTPVAAVARLDSTVTLTLVGRHAPLQLAAALPADVCWQVATRTSALAAELGRGGQYARPVTRTAR